LLAQRYFGPTPALFLDRDGVIIKDRDPICEPPDNRWIKLAELFPGDELEDVYAAQLCKGYGA
jgi:histidinol phosphatase-like enzyme